MAGVRFHAHFRRETYLVVALIIIFLVLQHSLGGILERWVVALLASHPWPLLMLGVLVLLVHLCLGLESLAISDTFLAPRLILKLRLLVDRTL